MLRCEHRQICIAHTDLVIFYCHHRRQLRPLLPLRLLHLPTRLLHARLRHQRRRHTRPHLHLDAPTPALFRPPPPLHNRTSESDSSHRELLPDTSLAGGMAEAEGVFGDDWV